MNWAEHGDVPKELDLDPLDRRHQLNFPTNLKLQELERRLAASIESAHGTNESPEFLATVDFTEKMGEAPSVDLAEKIAGALSAARKEISC